jgi:flagellar FliJ protein
MRRFNFKLESVRTLREQSQKQAEQELARELVLREQRAAELTAAEQRVESARDAVAAQPGQLVDGSDLAARQAYIERTERERAGARAVLAQQDGQVALGRKRLEAAARDREILERLKERRRVEHAQEAARSEQATLSEIAIIAHQRRDNEVAA